MTDHGSGIDAMLDELRATQRRRCQSERDLIIAFVVALIGISIAIGAVVALVLAR